MRNIFIILFTLLCVVTSCSKVDKKTQNEPKQEVNDGARYELYSTQNIWTFLKLDTRTGRIWQVQYSLESGKQGEWVLNDRSLTQNSEGGNGRFELYPTSNIFNFILLDHSNGKTYQVQWSQKEELRMVIPITDVAVLQGDSI
jgi:hypothetical protein bfra3_24007